MTRGQKLLLWIFLGGYLALLLTANPVVACYPVDNDLDEIGWIAAHQDLTRPESLANPNQPFAGPLLLKLLTPLCGQSFRPCAGG